MIIFTLIMSTIMPAFQSINNRTKVPLHLGQNQGVSSTPGQTYQGNTYQGCDETKRLFKIQFQMITLHTGSDLV